MAKQRRRGVVRYHVYVHDPALGQGSIGKGWSAYGTYSSSNYAHPHKDALAHAKRIRDEKGFKTRVVKQTIRSRNPRRRNPVGLPFMAIGLGAVAGNIIMSARRGLGAGNIFNVLAKIFQPKVSGANTAQMTCRNGLLNPTGSRYAIEAQIFLQRKPPNVDSAYSNIVAAYKAAGCAPMPQIQNNLASVTAWTSYYMRALNIDPPITQWDGATVPH